MWVSSQRLDGNVKCLEDFTLSLAVRHSLRRQIVVVVRPWRCQPRCDPSSRSGEHEQHVKGHHEDHEHQGVIEEARRFLFRHTATSVAGVDPKYGCAQLPSVGVAPPWILAVTGSSIFRKGCLPAASRAPRGTPAK